MFQNIRKYVWEKMSKKRKQLPPQGDDASAVLAATYRVGRASKVKYVQQSAHREVDLISI